MSGRFFLSGSIPLYEGAAQPLSTLTFSLTGTSTATDTYSDNNRSIANANPVVADANGYFGEIFLSRVRYKAIWKNAAGTTLKTWDPVDAESVLVKATSAPSDPWPGMIYDNTTDGKRYQRNLANSAWIDLGTTDTVSGASVTQQLAGTATNVLCTPDSVAALWQRGTDIASASSLSLPSTGGGVFNVTGTTTINGIGAAQGGRKVTLVFGGALTLTHNGSSFILPGAANITTEAGDIAEFTNEAAADESSSNWRMTNWQPDSASGTPIPNYAASQAEMESPSSVLKWVTPGRAKYHPGVAKAWSLTDCTGTVTIRSAHDVTSVTDGGAGIFTVNKTTAMSSANYAFTGTCGNSTGVEVLISYQAGAALTTTAVQIRCYQQASALFDPENHSVVLFGDE